MKFNAAFVFLITIFANGCTYSPFVINDFVTNQQIEVTVGSVMMAWGTGIKSDATGAIQDGIRKELSYSGIAQNVLQVTYREFSLQESGTYARQAFTQELKYDVSTSKMITFQDITIRVDSADQQKIRFIITRGPAETEALDIGKIGVRLNPYGEILDVVPNSPAAASGLQIGDNITRINGQEIPSGNMEAILERLDGKPGTDVKLTINRDNREILVIVKRQRF